MPVHIKYYLYERANTQYVHLHLQQKKHSWRGPTKERPGMPGEIRSMPGSQKRMPGVKSCSLISEKIII